MSIMARLRLLGLLIELASMVSLQQQLFAYVNENLRSRITPLHNETAVSEALFCLENRGSSGRWAKKREDGIRHDDDVGYYEVSSDSDSSADEPLTSRWGWQDDSGCEVSRLDTLKFCGLVQQLNVTRVLTVGDATMLDFAKSLRSILYNVTVTTTTTAATTTAAASSHPLPLDFATMELPCNGLVHTHIDFNRLPTLASYEPAFLANNIPGRSLVVVSQSATTKRVLDFHANLVELLEWVDEWRKPNDIIFYRSTVSSSVILQSTAATAAPTTTVRSQMHSNNRTIERQRMMRIEAYNNHAKQFLPDLRIRYLDVFHVSALPKDELTDEHHYPSDVVAMWVHMMYSGLLDLRKMEEQTSNVMFDATIE